MGKYDEDNLVPWKSSTVYAGQKYGRLTIVSTEQIFGTYKYYARCNCDCGTKDFVTRIDKLRNGTVTGCGCVQREVTTTHGCWGNPIFHVWVGLMSRCCNPKDKRYPYYGGRGITVCEEWKDVNKFILDMEPTYQKGLQIDRRDNDQGYNPDNCHWVTQIEQARNKSSNIKLSYDGKTLCLAEWSQITNLSYGTLWERVKILGWSAEKTLTTPPLDADSRCLLARNTRYGKIT